LIDVQAFNRALREIDITVVEKLVQDSLSQGIPAYEILNKGLIGVMSIVGVEFKANQLWVPEVLLAARNMHRGIALLKPVLLEKETSSQGTLVIDTVYGDIRDIGKNIVSVLMEGFGFRVIDLGINVPAEGFISAVAEHQPDIIGLSALLSCRGSGSVMTFASVGGGVGAGIIAGLAQPTKRATKTIVRMLR